VFDFKDVIRIFLLDYKPSLSHNFKGKMARNSYLSYGSFEKLSDLSFFLQGRNVNHSILSHETKTFTTETSLWRNERMRRDYEMFLCFAHFANENEVDFEEVMQHLTNP
jgi:hypothetical protein